jgi:chromosome partitioning protein
MILIPTTYGRYSLDGIVDRSRYILRNSFDSRNRQTNEYIERQLESVRDQLLETVIRKTEAINQAQISGEPIFTFDPQGHGAHDFDALTREILQHG